MSYIQSESRPVLRKLRTTTLANRRLIQAGALEELARRAMLQFVHPGCSEARVDRLDTVLIGRRRQIIQILIECHPAEGAKSYAPHIDSVALMRVTMQSHRARAVIDNLMRRAANHGL